MHFAKHNISCESRVKNQYIVVESLTGRQVISIIVRKHSVSGCDQDPTTGKTMPSNRVNKK